MNMGYFIALLLAITKAQVLDNSIRWFPIQVDVKSDDPLLLAITNEVIEEWNRVSPQQLFQYLDKSTTRSAASTCTIFFEYGDVVKGRTTMKYITNDPVVTQTHAEVVVVMTYNTPTPIQSLKNILLHELGHVLNLDHDEDKESVMYWKLKDGIQYQLNSPIKSKLLKSNKNLYC
jgi:predicted Zn-dependent protease